MRNRGRAQRVLGFDERDLIDQVSELRFGEVRADGSQASGDVRLELLERAGLVLGGHIQPCVKGRRE